MPVRRKRAVVGGGGFLSKAINRTIDALPVELHLPGGFRFCGPGTRLQERLARGEVGINPLDEACRIHDIAYSTYTDSDRRREADKELAKKAWTRVKASDSSLKERAAALAVTAAMKVKSKIGGGKRKKKSSGKGLYLKPYKKTGRGVKKGGILPLLPIFAGLSALGSLAGGASAVAKVISDSKNAKKNLAEIKRHNLAMEGKGMYLKPYKGRGKVKKKKQQKKTSFR